MSNYATSGLMLTLIGALAACQGQTVKPAPKPHDSNTSGSPPSLSGPPSSTEITLPQSNHYRAPYTNIAPTIDGNIEPAWHTAPWQAIDVLWLGAQTSYPSARDFSGRYKVLWDEKQLYLLMHITDDVIFDGTVDPLSNYWIDDTVELFIDPDRSGGEHHLKNSFNAWAYHISTAYDVVDFGPNGPSLYNDHITVIKKTEASQHIWEMSIRIYDQDPKDSNAFKATAANLQAGKVMGFSASYIDNDNSLPSGEYQRESMMGSVDTPGHKDNQGYLNADVLGTLTLVGPE